MTAAAVLHGGCAATYLVLTALILSQARLSRTGMFLSGACIMTATWAASVVAFPISLLSGILDLTRSAAWCLFVLHLYRHTVRGGQQVRQAFVMLALVAALIAVVMALMDHGGPANPGALWSFLVIGRLGLAVCAVLLIENLYLNTPEETRWHINLPCVALGALSVYDIALSADALLFRRLSLALYDGRALATIIVAPLLVLAAARNRRDWDVTIHVSRSAVFHSATLVVSGIFLLGLVLTGEAFRYVGANWGGVAEISLIFAGLVTIGVLLTSRTARSRMRRLVVDHFFNHRYDYRREWVRCIETLSTPDAYVALHTRVIRAVAEIVDSPGGVLFLRETANAAFHWAGSLNMPAASVPVMADEVLIPALRGGDWIVELAGLTDVGGIAGAWLAVPLAHRGKLIGFILIASPRVRFKLDSEVFDLLRVVGRQVATYVEEQRATEILLQTRQLHDYGRRFAFVAHDIKNVSSQLSLLLSNAEVHLANPEFQRDMLATIRASVQKIGALIKRLQAPESDIVQAVIMPGERLEAIVENSRRARSAKVELEFDARSAGVAMTPASFDAVVLHLLDNAIEATRSGGQDPAAPVRISLRHEARRVLVDITDRGSGMTPEFVREELFRPFRTSKPDGSGIGAYQARELLREVGGDLLVISQPGSGTTMRVLLPAVEGGGGDFKEKDGRAAVLIPQRVESVRPQT